MSSTSRIVIGPNDVLCGRGRESFHHEGNKRFRETVTGMIDRFSQATTRAERSAVVATIWNTIRNRGGRFLKRSESRVHQVSGDGNGEWYQLSDQQAKEKVAHAIRDACANSMEAAYKRGANNTLLVNNMLPADFQATSKLENAVLSSASSERYGQANTVMATNNFAGFVQNEEEPGTIGNVQTSHTLRAPGPSSFPSRNIPSLPANHASSDIYQNLQWLTEDLKAGASHENLMMDLEPDPIRCGTKLRTSALRKDDYDYHHMPSPLVKKTPAVNTLKSEYHQEHNEQDMAERNNALRGSLFEQPQQQVQPIAFGTLPHPPLWTNYQSNSGSDSSSSNISINRKRTAFPPSSLLHDELFPGETRIESKIPPRRPRRNESPLLSKSIIGLGSHYDPLLGNPIDPIALRSEQKIKATGGITAKEFEGSWSSNLSLSPKQRSLTENSGDSFSETINSVLGPLTPEQIRLAEKPCVPEITAPLHDPEATFLWDFATGRPREKS